jgi:hypothetical protein
VIKMQDLNELIRGTFDFELEDQPDSIEGYDGLIQFMWLQCAKKGLDNAMFLRINEILSSNDEPEYLINFNFLPGKHDTRALLTYANNYYSTQFFPKKDFFLDQLAQNLANVKSH